LRITFACIPRGPARLVIEANSIAGIEMPKTEKKPYMRPALRRREKLTAVAAVTVVSGKVPK